jgi:amicyanin
MARQIVKIEGFAFVPQNITIAEGDEVVWQNNSEMAHTATRTGSPAFDTGPIAPDHQSAPIQFGTIAPAELEYSCRPHPFMKGKVFITKGLG